MATIETLLKIVASVSGGNVIKSLAKDISNVSTSAQNVTRGLQGMGTAVKTFGAALAANGIINFIQSGIDLADNLNDISQRTGVAVESLAKYKVAADNSGTSIDQLAGGINKLNRSVIAAQDPASKQAAAFRAIGVSIKDANGNLRPTSDLIGDIADKFSRYQDGAAKSALATDLLGKSGADLIPFLNQGREEIERYGLAIDTDLAQKADAFNDQIGLLKTNFQNVSIAIGAELLPGLISIGEAMNENDVAINVVVNTVKVLETAFVGLMYGGSLAMQTIANAIAGASIRAEYFLQVLQAVSTLDFNAVTEAGKKRDADLADRDKNAAEWAERERLKYQKMIDGIWNPKQPEPRAPRSPAATGNGRGGAVLNYNPGGSAAAGRSADNEARKMADTIEDLKKKIAVLNTDTASIGLNNAEREKAKTLAEFEARGIEKTSDAYRELSTAIDENTAAHRTFEAGAYEALNDYIDHATNAAEQTKKVFDDAFKGMEDALVDFITTGKLNFTDLANSIIKDIARILVQQTITGPIAEFLKGSLGSGGGASGFFGAIKSALGFANGGIMTSAGALPLNAYSSGGIANSPQLALFGEGRTPEAFVPLPDGRRIPVALKGGMGGNQNNVSVTVNVDGSGDSKSDSKNGAELGRVIASSVKSILINEKRPGGLLAAT